MCPKFIHFSSFRCGRNNQTSAEGQKKKKNHGKKKLDPHPVLNSVPLSVKVGEKADPKRTSHLLGSPPSAPIVKSFQAPRLRKTVLVGHRTSTVVMAAVVSPQRESILVPVVLDLALGDRRLQDSFQWPLYYQKVQLDSIYTKENPLVFEPIDQDHLLLFATQICSDLDLPSAFDTAVAKAIRSQLNAFEFMWTQREKLIIRKKAALEYYRRRKAETLYWAQEEEKRLLEEERKEAAALAADQTGEVQPAAPPAPEATGDIVLPEVEDPPGIELIHKEARVTIWVRRCRNNFLKILCCENAVFADAYL